MHTEEFTTKVAEVFFIAEAIAEHCNYSISYEQAVQLADELDIEVEQVFKFYNAYKILQAELFNNNH